MSSSVMAMEIRVLETEFDYQSYQVFFSGHPIYTTVTSNPDRVSDWIWDVIKKQNPSDRLVVGYCTEVGHREGTPIAVIHLCVGDTCLVYQILHSSHIPLSLSNFLSDEYNTFVGVGVKDEVDRLQKEYGIGGEAWTEELGELATNATGMDGYRSKGLETLASCVLDLDIAEEAADWVCRSWWDNSLLSLEQVMNASFRAFLSFRIGRALIKHSLFY